MLTRFHYLLVGLGVCSLFLLGCGGKDTAPVSSPTTQSHEDHSPHDHATDGDSKVAKALASLSAEDRAAAEAQKVCPVSEEPLGSMGTPIKVSVNGRDVFVCCDGCTDTLLADPDKYLEKLPQE